ncbi:hypothetical protein [Mogibacterium diversum]
MVNELLLLKDLDTLLSLFLALRLSLEEEDRNNSSQDDTNYRAIKTIQQSVNIEDLKDYGGSKNEQCEEEHPILPCSF